MSKAFKLVLQIAVIMIGSSNFTAVVAQASKEMNLNPFKTIETVIGAGELNRLQIKDGELLEVVGNENQYSLY